MNEDKREQEIAQIQEMNSEAKVAIARNDAYKRLLDNADYKLIILDGYCKQYPKELAEAIVGNTGAYDTDTLVENLKAINTFHGYGFQIINTASAAEQALVSNQQFLDELGGEDDDGAS